MAKFMVKASEFKNVCKAVNDRKLAELKKEIIEILKKQDEKDFKKATDYLNSQEEHFTHLEKSLSGKWIEKAGYGIGTVRVWKGKKYKKIAPNKWVRVFDKEGRGTNIAIGKLIARVQKIDNVEDLMAFVMANKQRFVDENGVDLPVLDKLRAAVGVKNENLSGESSSYTYGVGENVSRTKNEMFSKKDKIKKEEADLHKVSRKLSQIPTTELKQEKARLERAVANKTRSKRDSLNNVIFRESNQEKLDAINKELENRSPVKAEKTVEDKIKENPDYPFKPKTEKERAERAAFEKDRDDFIERMDKIRQENKKKDSKPAEKYDDDKAYKEYQKLLMKENPTTADNERLGELVTEHYKHSKKEWIGGQGLKELNAAKDEDEVLSNGKTVKEVREQYGIGSEKPAEKEEEYKTYWIQDPRGNRLTNEDAKKKIIGQMKYLAELEDMAGKKLNNRTANDIRYYIDYLKDRLNPEDRMEIENIEKKNEKDSGDIEQKKIDMQMQLLELNKNRQDNNKNIKKLNSKLAELKQKKAEDEVRGNSVEKYDKEIKDTQKEIDNLLDDNYSIESKGTKIAKELNEIEKNGVKKSMFDDFVIDMFIDDEIEDEEELKEGETEYNDYSAEQPELFNSTAMKVREALDRINNQVL